VQFDVRAFALTTAFFFAGTVAVVGAVNAMSPGYGQPVLDLFASLYPGYSATGTLTDWLVGIVIALVDGVIGGAVFAWLYNRLSTS